MRWIKEDTAVIYIKECYTYFFLQEFYSFLPYLNLNDYLFKTCRYIYRLLYIHRPYDSYKSGSYNRYVSEKKKEKLNPQRD